MIDKCWLDKHSLKKICLCSAKNQFINLIVILSTIWTVFDGQSRFLAPGLTTEISRICLNRRAWTLLNLFRTRVGRDSVLLTV